MSDAQNTTKNAAVKHENAYSSKHKSTPQQLTVAWHSTARLSEGDPLYRVWQTALKRPHEYDWTRAITKPDDWAGTEKAWGVFARKTVRRLKNPANLNNQFSEDEWTPHHQHVHDAVWVLRRHGLLPDWALYDPLAVIPKRTWKAARKLMAANNGVVWLAVMPLDCPTRLNVTADVQRLLKHGKAVLKALSNGTRSWGAVEVTPTLTETVYDHETDDTYEIQHGAAEHMGIVAGEGADLSGCTYVRQARSVWDVVFWTHYHSAGYDSRLKVKVVFSKKGAAGAVKKGSRYYTVHVPHAFSMDATSAVSDGLAVRAGLQWIGRKSLNAQTFTVNNGAGRRTKIQPIPEIKALESVPDGTELPQYNKSSIDSLSRVLSADRREAPPQALGSPVTLHRQAQPLTGDRPPIRDPEFVDHPQGMYRRFPTTPAFSASSMTVTQTSNSSSRLTTGATWRGMRPRSCEDRSTGAVQQIVEAGCQSGWEP